MSHRRIHLVGGPGSGKSYIAARIGAMYGIAVYALDNLFWDPTAPAYGVRADRETRNQALASIVARDAWVIEGAYYKWLAPSFERAERIILLNPSVWVRDWRIVKRTALRRLGRGPSAKKEALASTFTLIQWNHTYQRDQLAPTRAMLARLNKPPIECRTLADVLAALAPLPDRPPRTLDTSESRLSRRV